MARKVCRSIIPIWALSRTHLNARREDLDVNLLNGRILRVYGTTELCKEARRILDEPNAGGNSVKSEAFAMQILQLTHQAKSV